MDFANLLNIVGTSTRWNLYRNSIYTVLNPWMTCSRSTWFNLHGSLVFPPYPIRFITPIYPADPVENTRKSLVAHKCWSNFDFPSQPCIPFHTNQLVKKNRESHRATNRISRTLNRNRIWSDYKITSKLKYFPLQTAAILLLFRVGDLNLKRNWFFFPLVPCTIYVFSFLTTDCAAILAKWLQFRCVTFS